MKIKSLFTVVFTFLMASQSWGAACAPNDWSTRCWFQRNPSVFQYLRSAGVKDPGREWDQLKAALGEHKDLGTLFGGAAWPHASYLCNFGWIHNTDGTACSDYRSDGKEKQLTRGLLKRLTKRYAKLGFGQLNPAQIEREWTATYRDAQLKNSGKSWRLLIAVSRSLNP